MFLNFFLLQLYAIRRRDPTNKPLVLIRQPADEIADFTDLLYIFRDFPRHFVFSPHVISIRLMRS